LDQLEREGPPPGAISEVAGASGSGVTSLAVRLAARAARLEQRIACSIRRTPGTPIQPPVPV